MAPSSEHHHASQPLVAILHSTAPTPSAIGTTIHRAPATSK